MQQRFEVLCIDLFGPLVTSPDGYRFVLVVEDTASRWVELLALRSATAEVCAGVLLDEVLLRYGMCRRLVSDNGPQFISAVLQQLAFVLGFKQNLIPVYHPEANQVERKNRDLKTQLAILVGGNHADWPSKLASIRFAMNSAKCTSTGQTAAYLTFGRELRTADGVQRDLRAIVEGESFASEILPKLRSMTDTLRQAREIQELTQDQRKAYADRHRQASPRYQPGNFVLVQTHTLSNTAKGISAKLAPRFDGPYEVVRQVGPTSYEIAVGKQGEARTLYHVSALKPFVSEGNQRPEPVAPIRRRGRPRGATPGVADARRRRGRPRKHADEEISRSSQRDALGSEGGVCNENSLSAISSLGPFGHDQSSDGATRRSARLAARHGPEPPTTAQRSQSPSRRCAAPGAGEGEVQAETVHQRG